MKKEFCIMPKNEMWEIERTEYNVRHEVFFGTSNRKKSIEDGLVIFLKPEMHNMSNFGIHFDRNFDLYAKRIAEQTYLEYYHKTINDFIKRYGKNFLRG